MNPRRRAALGAIVAAALAPGFAAGEDRARIVGYLSNGSPPDFMAKRLAALGWIEGKNMRFEVRRVEGEPPYRERRMAAAAELVGAQPNVLFAFGAPNVRALMAATATIPIVCGGTPDPVGSGLTRSIRRSGTNVTGLSYGIPEQAEIQVGLFRAVLPGIKRIVMIFQGSSHEGFVVPLRSLTDMAKAAGISWEWAGCTNLADAERAFAALRDPRREAVFAMVNRTEDEFPLAKLAGMALRRRIATMCADDAMVREGGLMSYSIDHADQMGRVAALIDKMLRGGNPADTSFELPDRTSFVVKDRKSVV